jgi:peptidoglycan/xylan/chitin deacetylase (PgdA/CDA1 family)
MKLERSSNTSDRTMKVAAVIAKRTNHDIWRPRNQRLAVLLYHHVGTPSRESKTHRLTVSPAKFRRQVRWLRWRGYTAITPSQWLAWCLTGVGLPKKAIMFTFDEAYADIPRYALPVLERFGFQSAAFVISRQTDWCGLRLMTMEQIRDCAKRGVEFGAHTRTHPDLTAVPAKMLADEIQGSKQDLVKAGLNPVSFAYPHGCYNDRVRASVSGIFPIAFTIEEGLNDSSSDPLLLKRTTVWPNDMLIDIEFRAALGRSPLDWLRSRIRLRSRLFWALRQLKLLPP